MTKKHFQLVANILAREVASAENLPHDIKLNETLRTLRAVAESFASEFAKVNLNFDRARFMAACGF